MNGGPPKTLYPDDVVHPLNLAVETFTAIPGMIWRDYLPHNGKTQLVVYLFGPCFSVKACRIYRSLFVHNIQT